MLQQIIVKGFRSLVDFQLDIREGLNVLVGPNGAGKTNIMLFFEFLRTLAASPISAAVGEAGGVAQVFVKKGKVQFQDSLSARISGKVSQGKSEYSYFFEFSIKFNKAGQDVYYASQRLVITEASENTLYMDVVFEYQDPGDPASDSFKIDLAPEIKKPMAWLVKHYKEAEVVKRGIFRQRLLLNMVLGGDDVVKAVMKDFSGRFVLNVVPSHVKRPEDSTRSPGIESDGSGVSSTLYAIKRGRSFYDEIEYVGRSAPRPVKVRYSDVIDLIKVAVPSVQSIDVVSDPFDNLLRCQIAIGKNGKSVLPLSSMSDGSVKWISLILRLATSRSALLLEEPENYLHPLMQREIVRLLRDSVSDVGFSMVSTHSETLLNAVRAEELIIVSYGSKGTKAKRVTNASDIESEINKTGFGLGYYYLADAVEAR